MSSVVKYGLVICCCLTAGLSAGIGKALPADTELDGEGYRVRVESIFQAPDFAMYRVQVWTLNRRPVYLCQGADRQIASGPAKSQLEPGGKLHRVDMVILVSLRPPEEPRDRGQKVQLVRYFRVGVGKCEETISDTVNATTQLKDLVQIKEQSGLARRGTLYRVGEVLGQQIAVEAR